MTIDVQINVIRNDTCRWWYFGIDSCLTFPRVTTRQYLLTLVSAYHIVNDAFSKLTCHVVSLPLSVQAYVAVPSYVCKYQLSACVDELIIPSACLPSTCGRFTIYILCSMFWLLYQSSSQTSHAASLPYSLPSSPPYWNSSLVMFFFDELWLWSRCCKTMSSVIRLPLYRLSHPYSSRSTVCRVQRFDFRVTVEYRGNM